jgi:hypothetical protein
MEQIVQVIGALLILAAYAAAQFGALDQRSRVYLVLNLVGSAVLTVLAWHEDRWGFSSWKECGRWSRSGG